MKSNLPSEAATVEQINKYFLEQQEITEQMLKILGSRKAVNDEFSNSPPYERPPIFIPERDRGGIELKWFTSCGQEFDRQCLIGKYCKWFMNETVLNHITNIRDDNGKPIWRKPLEGMLGRLNAAYTEIEKQIGYPLELEERCETQTVKDNRIILDTINLIKVNEITDLTKKTDIENFTVDYPNKTINFVPCKTEQHQILITYESGYTKETHLADLKEAIIKLFIYKQQTLRKMNNAETTETTLPQEIQTTITHYSRKSL